MLRSAVFIVFKTKQAKAIFNVLKDRFYFDVLKLFAVSQITVVEQIAIDNSLGPKQPDD